MKSEDDLKKQAPTLILPNREQDYTGSYFQEIFPKAVRTLHESKILVIVGYSLPEEDALIRLLIRQFAEENVDLTEKFIFYISTSDEEEQYEKLHSVYPYLNDRLKERIITYSGTFNSWLEEVLKFAE
ncbi:SIR2 family protein [Chryseobacterium polytrichastri]|uniref:SIR2-like domain-containing protein n=1 Tax=Chryseobacterium polytrichastri TaxID=1302687 RepID=A0A1M7BTC2_9FLAO|nr:SIR2 family protein [Chryseobacterium polytrichastri]SHL58262.1 SIR2-like domain-containing protein [Chryseobacterium polytrichastri]